MSVSAFAPEFTDETTARHPARPMSPAFAQAVYEAQHPIRAGVRLALRAIGYTAAAILGLGGLPAATALFYDVNTFAVMFAL